MLHTHVWRTRTHLALELQRRSIGILEHVHLFDGHQIGWVFEVVHEVFVDGASLVGDQVEAVTLSIVDKARVHVHAECVSCVRVARPFVEHALTDECKLHRLAV